MLSIHYDDRYQINERTHSENAYRLEYENTSRNIAAAGEHTVKRERERERDAVRAYDNISSFIKIRTER